METILAIEHSSVLIVDDDIDASTYLGRLLRRNGFTKVTTSSDPNEAIALYLENAPDLVIVDLHIPVLSGIEIMLAIREMDPEGDHVPVIMVTADTEPSAKRNALEAGCNDFIDKFAEDYEVMLRVRNCLRTRQLHLAMKRQNADLEQQVQERTQDTISAQEEIVQRLAAAAEHRDDKTGQHVERVGNLAAELAVGMGLSRKETEVVRRGAKLHDIGKIGIPDSILYKPGPLTEEERNVMQTHTLIGDQILAGGSAELVKTAQVIARSHHERWNGAGYPDGLSGSAIPLVGRIVAVADVFDALITKRPYKEAFPIKDSVAIILEESGKHFDPELVAVFSDIPESRLVELGSHAAGTKVESGKA